MEEYFELAKQSTTKLRTYLKEEDPNLLESLKVFQHSKGLSWSQSVYHFLNGDLDLTLGKCKECGEKTFFRSFNEGYKTYCSKLCANRASKEKRFAAFRQNWGVNHPNQHPEIKAKIKQTNIERWGTDNFAKSSEHKKRIRKVSLEKYGVEHYKMSPKVKETYRKKFKSKWGKNWPMEHPLIKAKIKKTIQERYGTSNPRYCHIDAEVQEYMHSRSWWEELYLVEGLTPKEIVEETGLSLSFIYKQLQYFGLLNKEESEEAGISTMHDTDLFKPIF